MVMIDMITAMTICFVIFASITHATMLHAFMHRSIFTLHTLLGIVGAMIINFHNFGNAIYLVFTKLDVKFDFLAG